MRRNQEESIHFPEEFISKVKENNDIVEVAGEFFELSKVGAIYQTSCIHGDKNTKSLTFFPKTQSFYCFGCQAGAKDVTGSSDVIAFVSWIENLPWKEAVIYLARRANISLPEVVFTDEEKKLQAMYETRRIENISYWESLNESTEVKSWFLNRGITQVEIDEWRLGNDNGKPVYAIIDDVGRTCAFSKRRKPSEEEGPKYRNSNESPIFIKGSILYGLHRVKRLIRKLGYAVIVEGFNDVIILQKFGVPAVGIMSTSLTDDQINLLKRYTTNIVLFLDGDEGGELNTWRLIDKLQKHNVSVQVMDTPGLDPDDLALIKKEGTTSYLQCTAMLAGQYKVGKLTSKFNETTVLLGKELIKDLTKVLTHVEDPIEKEMYINQVASTLGIRAYVIHEALEKEVKTNAI